MVDCRLWFEETIKTSCVNKLSVHNWTYSLGVGDGLLLARVVTFKKSSLHIQSTFGPFFHMIYNFMILTTIFFPTQILFRLFEIFSVLILYCNLFKQKRFFFLIFLFFTEKPCENKGPKGVTVCLFLRNSMPLF